VRPQPRKTLRKQSNVPLRSGCLYRCVIVIMSVVELKQFHAGTSHS